jgi:DnaJ-class molecular chaperone
MNVKCSNCKGRGTVEGKQHTKSGKPYDKVCPECNGVGHYRV